MNFDLFNNAMVEAIKRGADSILPRIPEAIVAFLIGFVIIKVLGWLIEFGLTLVRLPKGLKGILASLASAILWVFLLVSVLQALGLTGLALIFSGSVATLGLALGLGASSLASDVLAGVFLAQDRDFVIGDEVSAGDKPTEGIVESMDMRRTRIRDKKGQLHVIPNSVIERKEWVVLTKKKDLPK